MNINFEKVNIGFASGANSGALLYRNGETASGGHDDNAGNAIFNITLTDCTLDYVTNHSSASTGIVNASKNATDTKDDVKLVFDGCDIILPKLSDLNMTNATEGDSVLFKNCMTNGTRILTKAEASEGEFTPMSFEGYGLTLKEQAAEDGYFVYSLTSKALEELVYIPKASITLDSNLIFNIYIPEHEGLKAAKLDGDALTLGEAEDGYYKVSVELAAKEAAKTMELVVNLEIDGLNVNGTFTFSLQNYAKSLLAAEGIKTEEQTLIKDILAYVRSAYVYFNGASSSDEEIVAIDELLAGYEDKTLSKVEDNYTNDDAEILEGVTFVLEATPRIRFYLPSDANISDYTFKIGNSVLEYTTGTETAEGSYKNLTYVDISLYAYRMIENITITKDDLTSCYNIVSYVNGALDSSDGALKNIVSKFYIYCESASAYRTAVAK